MDTHTQQTKGSKSNGTTITEAPVTLTVTPPKFVVGQFRIVGTAPLMQCRFSAKAMAKMRATHEAGSTAKKDKKKEPRDFNADFMGARHLSKEGWDGIPASAFRNACIDVCRMVGYKMTHAKMSIFCEADGLDVVDGIPLVKLEAGEPEKTEMAVRNATGVVDIRVRPMWREWGAVLRIRFDSEQFTLQDVTNLLARAGQQVGIGEGRPFSKDSNGMGFGLFVVEEVATK